nr:uncharacterized protein LOC127308248 isoform X1 [Lolium perenne]
MNNNVVMDSMSDSSDWSTSDDSDIDELLQDDDVEMMSLLVEVQSFEDRAKAMDRRRGSTMGRTTIYRNRALGHEHLMEDYFAEDKEDDLMADKMEPVLNPEYPETTETCIGSSSFLISISCTMLVRLMDDGWLAARHDLGHCLTAAVACCSRKPPAEDGWQGSCLSNVDQMRRW